MMRYRIGGLDPLDIRFTLSPLAETTLSLRTLLEPARFPLQVPWVERTRAALAEVDTGTLRLLVNDRNQWPDFLSPTAATTSPAVEEELAALRAVPRATFERDLVAVLGGVPPALAGPGRAPVRRVAAAVEGYWHACVAPYWDRMRAVLTGDIVHRGHQLSSYGLRATLASLSPTVELAGDTIRIASRSGIDRTVDVAGRGLTLTPTLFSTRATFPVSPASPPALHYPARGQATMWAPAPPSGSAGSTAVARLLGRTRAHLLRLLDEPRASVDLAADLHLTASAVNQHLRLMRDAGLLSSARHGRRVLYARTPAGDVLMPPG